MKRKVFTSILVLSSLSALGFSPYENYLLTGRQTHVALMVSATDEKAEELATTLKTLNTKQAGKAFKKVKISNVSSHTKELQGKPWFMVYFDYDGETYQEAVSAFESTKAVKELIPLLEPHPRAKEYGNHWLQLEWINYIKGAKPTKNPTNKFAMVTRLKPEKEDEYRWLHQNTWPGTVDRMTRMKYHDFSIFLVELGDEIYEFFYVEFVGMDASKDKMGSLSDPTYERWIKYTDPCQDPLPDADGIWSMMNKVSE
jgi:L-rhamnose mutarotase